MKLIIDVPEEIVKKGFEGPLTDEERMIIIRAVGNAVSYEERLRGKWVKIFENPFTNGYVCPFCGHKIQVTEQFLPKVTKCEGCGAIMRGAE